MALPAFDLHEYPTRRRARYYSRWIWVLLLVFLLATVFHFRRPANDFYHSFKDQPPSHSSDQEQGYFASEHDQSSPEYSPDSPSPLDDASADAASLPSSAPLPQPTLPSPIPDDTPIDHSNPRGRLPQEMQELLHWEPPVWATLHRPHYADFLDRDYDPNRWEGFDKNINFFQNNTLSTDDALSGENKAIPYAPYPDYNSHDWHQKWRGDFVPCLGLSGKSLNESQDEVVKAYKRKPHSFADPDVGSFEALDLDDSVCFDRVSRFAHVGGVHGNEIVKNIDLGELQNQCLERNKERYEIASPPDLRPGVELPESHADFTMDIARSQRPNKTAPGPRYKPRTAVLIRSYENYEYEPNDIQAIRSLVSELTLQSGGEYHIFLFVNLKDENVDIYSDPGYIDEKMQQIPDELRNMTILWNEKICAEVYPDVGQYQVLLAQFMPVQWFMETHPEFEYVWNWEMDARYIGQQYHFVEKVVDFALRQPRKHLWERNARYYLPKIHGSWEQFFNETNRQIENSPFIFSPVWGNRHFDEPMVIGPHPPRRAEDDRYEWGVGEEADFISLLPIWDPRHTTWVGFCQWNVYVCIRHTDNWL